MLMADHSCLEEKLLIVWENNTLRTQKVMETIHNLKYSYSLRVCVLEEDAPELEQSQPAAVVGKEVQDLDALFDGIRLVLLPMVSDTLLADLAEGKIHNPLEMVVMEALCKGIPVRAFAYGRNMLPASSEAAIVYQKKRRQLFQYCGIELILWEEFHRNPNIVRTDQLQTDPVGESASAAAIPTSNRRKVITEDDINEFVKENKKLLVLNQGDLITPLAADTARELGMLLSFDE
jgi:hypothetical protein